MSDPRLTPANGRVAASYLKGKVDSQNFVDGEINQCRVAAADILGKPNGRRTSQLLYGDLFLALEMRDGHVFGQSVHDGYCGYVRSDLLGQAEDTTHWVSVPQTHLYPGPNVKLMTQGALYFGSEVSVAEVTGAWTKLSNGAYVPSSHLLPLTARWDDPVGVADLFLGTPYLWGGGSRYGIDCSGLVQLAWRVCGLDCPRDSDMQEAELGKLLPEGAPVERGDLVFWKGHVGLVAGQNRLLHANAHHMAVAYEPLDEAILRIADAGGGPVTSVRRP
ncbi:MAG: NlpC/P60 family protein [Litoreibacter sp.]|nr:NlpC/P60 family protein [Litoreibacter sp.]MCY4336601.1 NlpC/P60 family protein [Litoreibacter sp.]